MRNIFLRICFLGSYSGNRKSKIKNPKLVGSVAIALTFVFGGAAATAQQPKKVSPSGYGIHWPELDEDLSIDGMIKAAKVRKAG